MARFTIEQKKISEAMKLLIDLYYRFPEIDPLKTDPKDLFSSEIIQLLARIRVCCLSFSRCQGSNSVNNSEA